MFCPRAMSVLFGVGVCALMSGCGSIQMPADELTRQDHPKADESQTVIVASASIPATETARPVSREEIIEWSIRSVSDDVILSRLERSNTVFHLTASDEIHLRDAGVSAEVVRAMRCTAD